MNIEKVEREGKATHYLVQDEDANMIPFMFDAALVLQLVHDVQMVIPLRPQILYHPDSQGPRVKKALAVLPGRHFNFGIPDKSQIKTIEVLYRKKLQHICHTCANTIEQLNIGCEPLGRLCGQGTQWIILEVFDNEDKPDCP